MQTLAWQSPMSVNRQSLFDLCDSRINETEPARRRQSSSEILFAFLWWLALWDRALSNIWLVIACCLGLNDSWFVQLLWQTTRFQSANRIEAAIEKRNRRYILHAHTHSSKQTHTLIQGSRGHFKTQRSILSKLSRRFKWVYLKIIKANSIY